MTTTAKISSNDQKGQGQKQENNNNKQDGGSSIFGQLLGIGQLGQGLEKKDSEDLPTFAEQAKGENKNVKESK